ncbi:LysE family transporter [Candidatus Woesebacteria bacterium]|nr:LysE family transporter [Candidatus Woesebacteria bacterium]
MTQNLITAFFLGLIGGAIPGPVLTAIFTEILQFGFKKSFRIILLAMFSESIVAVVSLVTLASIGLPEGFFMGVSFVGAGILLWIASTIWKIKRINTKEKIHFGFGKIFVMILANGLLWTFWITICIPKAIQLNEKMLMGGLVFLTLVELGWLTSTVFLAFVFSRFRSLMSQPKVAQILFKIFALIFVYFALEMTYKSIMFFIK